MLWGGTFIAGRVIAFEIPAQIAALMRFIVASILLMIILIKVEGSFKTINLKQHLLTACMGLTGVFAYNIFSLVRYRICKQGEPHYLLVFHRY